MLHYYTHNNLYKTRDINDNIDLLVINNLYKPINNDKYHNYDTY